MPRGGVMPESLSPRADALEALLKQLQTRVDVLAEFRALRARRRELYGELAECDRRLEALAEPTRQVLRESSLPELPRAADGVPAPSPLAPEPPASVAPVAIATVVSSLKHALQEIDRAEGKAELAALHSAIGYLRGAVLFSLATLGGRARYKRELAALVKHLPASERA